MRSSKDRSRHHQGVDDRVWYVAYGSNMATARFHCYVRGGRPAGARVTLPGCRDTTPPEQWRAVHVPGAIHFALESPTWTGGMAFYDPDAPGRTPARAWLVTREQFCDVVDQEMHRPVGTEFALDLADGERVALGPGRYETLVRVGTLDDRPMLTCTCPWRTDDVDHRPPSRAYLRILAIGLAETHGWDGARAAAYLGA